MIFDTYKASYDNLPRMLCKIVDKTQEVILMCFIS
jgi:hypothetical protein